MPKPVFGSFQDSEIFNNALKLLCFLDVLCNTVHNCSYLFSHHFHKPLLFLQSIQTQGVFQIRILDEGSFYKVFNRGIFELFTHSCHTSVTRKE